MKIHNVVLVGFMGTGKSTIGKYLADQLGWIHIDTDQRIETDEAVSIAEIFNLQGESYFREIESRVIREIMGQQGQVISTGGGAVLAEANRQQMLDNSLVVALTADEQTIINRVSRDRNRPLLQGDVRQKVSQLLEQREHAYDFAHMQIDTSNLSIEAVIQTIKEEIEAG
jgi:shikimate kinase